MRRGFQIILNETTRQQPEGQVCSAQRVGFFNIGSGRVLDKIPGSESGSGRVGVLKYSIGYFRVFRVFLGISGHFRAFLGISVYFLYFSY